MVVIPICVLVAVGAVLLGGLRHTGTFQQQALALLWPETGKALSVLFALSSLRAASEKKKFKLNHVASDIHLLEGAGVQILVMQRDEGYLTAEADEDELRRMVQRKCGMHGAALVWDGDGLFFRYEGVKNGTVIMGTGIVPLMGDGADTLIPPSMRETILNAIFIFLILIARQGYCFSGDILRVSFRSRYSHLSKNYVLLRQRSNAVNSSMPCRRWAMMRWGQPAVRLTLCGATLHAPACVRSRRQCGAGSSSLGFFTTLQRR